MEKPRREALANGEAVFVRNRVAEKKNTGYEKGSTCVLEEGPKPLPLKYPSTRWRG